MWELRTKQICSKNILINREVRKLGKDVKKSSVRVSPITRLRLKKMSAKTGVKMIHLADEAVQKFCEKQEIK